MSRLFSRLENKEHAHIEGAPPAGTHADAAVPAPDARGADMPAAAGYRSPAMPSLLPAYATGAGPGMPPAGPAVARPVWPVRLWLASLLFLAGLSLLILVLPERLLPLAAQHPPSDSTSRPAAAPALKPAAAIVRNPAAPSAGAVVTASPAPRAPRREPPRPTAASAPAAPLPSSGSSACSEAMLAMNLCSKSSP